jgi:DNA-binding NtrC family response regulator
VVDANKEQSGELCALLERNHYRTLAFHALLNLEKNLQEHPCHAVLLDLDSLPVSNRFIRGLRRQNPNLCILVLSNRSFHPELEEAISTHIYACLSKPVDTEELIYWLKTTCV